MLGDSYVANAAGGAPTTRLDYRNMLAHANNVMGGPLRIRLAAMQGVSGETAAQILARVATVTGLVPRPKYCFVSAGNNDVHTGVATATTIANVTAIRDALNAAGIVMITGPVLPRDTWTADQRTDRETVNSAIAALDNDRTMIWCDWESATVDGGTGFCLANILYDGIHPGTRGARAMGDVIAARMGALLPKDAPIARVVDPMRNYFNNGHMAGSTAINSQGWTGTTATSWTTGFRSAVPDTALGTTTVSKVARSDGDGDWVQLNVSGVRHSDTGGWGGALSQTITPNTQGLFAGDWVESVVEFEVDAGAANLAGVGVTISESDGATNYTGNWTRFVTGGGAQQYSTWTGTTRLVVRTIPIQLRPGTASLFIRPGFAGEAYEAAGVSCVIRFRCALRKI